MLQLIDREPGLSPIDGAGTWQTNGQVNQLPHRFLDMVNIPITIGDTSYRVRVLSDDPELLDATERYHRISNELLPKPKESSKSEIEVLYATMFDLRTDSGEVRMGENPYVAVASSDGTQVLATGKPSVGTLKSICFGIASTVASRETRDVPLHASIGTFDGESAFAVSGRGNWGKTTNMIAAKINAPDLHVVTDDWSMINLETRRITPVDMLVAIRPEAVSGILAATGVEEPPAFLFEAQKDNGRLYTVKDVFGESPDFPNLRLDKVLLTDKRDEHAADISVYDTDDLNERFRLMDDAYHSPDVWGTHHYRYGRLAQGLEMSGISTRLPLELRAAQLVQIIKSLRGEQ